ncbi:MAG: DUF6361 family protein [Acidobacteriota bacterium]
MPSSLTWVDYDPEDRERSIRILSLFQEKDSRDELGLGAIRDSFADALFPGTTTIQTRMRYMLFVPWVYNYLENMRVSSTDFAARARRLELSLVEPLLKNSDDSGVFGKVAGGGLKRLPSSVYWNGLGRWGLRRIPWSQDEYHRYINKIYLRRDAAKGRSEKDESPDDRTVTWHPKLPKPPEGFPDQLENLSLDLESEEASFLLDQIQNTQKASLLAWLAANPKRDVPECGFPWEHPEFGSFREDHREILKYAEFFSVIMHGASYLYNLMLAEVAHRDELLKKHLKNIEDWRNRLSQLPYKEIDLEKLWKMVEGRGHHITWRAKDFVTVWCRRVSETGGSVENDTFCRTLVEKREKDLKGPKSRFTNSKARDQWSGFAGTVQMNYRWSNIKRFLSDLYAGLNGGGNNA